MFRSAPFLPDMVRRLAGLDPLPDEIVFLDDASPDDSAAVLRELAARTQPPLRYRIVGHETNAGIAASYNRLVREARCDWVHILDADDHPVERDFYARVAPELRPGRDLVITAIDSNSALLRLGARAFGWAVPENPPRWLPLLGSFATRSGVIYRRDAIAELPFPDPAFPGSDVLHLLAMRRARNCRFTRDAHVYYRVHATATSSQPRDYGRYRAALARQDAAVRVAHTVDLALRVVGQSIHRP